MHTTRRLVFRISLCLAAALPLGTRAQKPAGYADPFIGTGNSQSGRVNWKNGNTFPGAMMPWGMVSVSPYNAPGSKSGYLYGQPFLYGFGHVHLSGVGCSDLGNVVLMPSAGALSCAPEHYRSRYGLQKASPGYYQVTLEPSGIRAAMTATTRSGISSYVFPAGCDSAHILLDASVTENSRMMPAEGHVKILSSHEVEGWTLSGHFCGAPLQTQKVYFVAVFSSDAQRAGTWKGGRITDARRQTGRGVGAWMRFSGRRRKRVYVKVGISYVSIAGARLNLRTEQPGWDFAGVRKKAAAAWNRVLSRISVRGGSHAEKVIFYTALYHMLIHPSVFSDVNGDYLEMGHHRVGHAAGYTRYDVYSLWDTYRDEHPFLTLFYPGRARDMVRSLLEMYRESGWLPKWELAGNDTHVMVGDPAPVILAETYANGMRRFDTALAYRAMRHGASVVTGNPLRRHLAAYLTHHYIPADVRGSVSMTLEYGISDAATAYMAGVTGRPAEQAVFAERARYYRNLYDTTTGFLRPRKADGSWLKPFRPAKFKGTGFIEGSAWNYLFSVPQDEKGLAALMGGERPFIAKLERTFTSGRFALYNEPDIAYPYLFTFFAGQAWRTSRAVRKAMAANYTTGPGGLPGNDDCGALSAWYVFSAMGFYPADPLSGNFRLGSPVFRRITVRLDSSYYPGRTFQIRARHACRSHIYFRHATLNGRRLARPVISHDDIEKGGVLELDMRRRPCDPPSPFAEDSNK
jgi:predicted alpha-1,2-mannosidase